MITILTWSLEKNKPVLLYDQANNSWTVIYNESRPKRLPASNQKPPLMQNKSCRRWRYFSNSKYLQLPLVLNPWSVTPQLTDVWPFPPRDVCSLVAALCYAAPSSPASLTRQYDHLQPLQPDWPHLFRHCYSYCSYRFGYKAIILWRIWE